MHLSRNTHSIRLAKAYLLDWLVVAALVVSTFFIDRTTPFRRSFSVNDKTISYPFSVEETVPVPMLLGIIILFPIVVTFVVSVLVRRSPYDFHNSALGLAISLALTLVVTSVLKNTLGRLRPDFLDRCFRKDFLEGPQAPPPTIQDPMYGLTTMAVCIAKSDLYTFNDGMKSFPSGHASTSFSAMMFLSLFLAGKFRVFDKRGHTWKPFVVILPLIIAALVSISRICDYRHHWQDVVVGGLIGAFFAVFSYNQYYPSLWSSRPEKPHSPRVSKLVRAVTEQLGEGGANNRRPGSGNGPTALSLENGGRSSRQGDQYEMSSADDMSRELIREVDV